MQKYRNQVLAGLVVIAAALMAVVAITGAGEMMDKLGDFPAWLFGPVLLLKVANWALRYLEWRYWLGVIGVRTTWRGPTRAVVPGERATIRERDSALLWLAGLSLSISPGKLAEVLKALVLKNLTGTPFARSAPIIFVERLVDGLAVILLASASLLAVAGAVEGGDLSLGYVQAVLIVTPLALIAGVLLVQYRPLSLALLDRAATWPGLRRIERPLRTLYESSYDLLQVRHLLRTIPLGAGAYFCDGLGFYLLLTGLGVGASWTLLAQAVFILGFSVIVAALSAMPGGAGGRELTIGAMLTGVVGLSKTDAGTATFLISVFQVWAGVLLGLALIVVFRNVLFPPALRAEIAAYDSGAVPAQGG